jgi:hypothetical protein
MAHNPAHAQPDHDPLVDSVLSWGDGRGEAAPLVEAGLAAALPTAEEIAKDSNALAVREVGARSTQLVVSASLAPLGLGQQARDAFDERPAGQSEIRFAKPDGTPFRLAVLDAHGDSVLRCIEVSSVAVEGRAFRQREEGKPKDQWPLVTLAVVKGWEAAEAGEAEAPPASGETVSMRTGDLETGEMQLRGKPVSQEEHPTAAPSEAPPDEARPAGRRREKRAPGKLPPREEPRAKDSREAAAGMLKKLFNRPRR